MKLTKEVWDEFLDMAVDAAGSAGWKWFYDKYGLTRDSLGKLIVDNAENAEKWDKLAFQFGSPLLLREHNKQLEEKLGETQADLYCANDYIMSLEHDLDESNPITLEEEENKRLKAQVESHKGTGIMIENERQALQRENKRLKEKLDNLRDYKKEIELHWSTDDDGVPDDHEIFYHIQELLETKGEK